MKYTWLIALLSILGGMVLILDGTGQSFTFQTNIIFKVFEVIFGIAIMVYTFMKGFGG